MVEEIGLGTVFVVRRRQFTVSRGTPTAHRHQTRRHSALSLLLLLLLLLLLRSEHTIGLEPERRILSSDFSLSVAIYPRIAFSMRSAVLGLTTRITK